MRRTVLLLGVIVLAITAGCFGFGNDASDDRDPVDLVPGEVDAVATLDAGVMEDETTRSAVNPYLDATANGADDPRTLEELVEQYEDRLGENTSLPVQNVQRAAVFARTPGQETDEDRYLGVVVRGDWDEEAMLEELRDGSEFETREYGDRTLYVAEESDQAFAAVGSDLFVLGTRDAVTDAIDVADGEADAFGGDLRTAYESTPEDAHLRVAAERPDDAHGYAPTDAGCTPNVGSRAAPDLEGVFENVTHVAGAYHTDNGTIRADATLFVPTGDGAQRLADDLDAMVQLAPQLVADDAVAERLSAVEVERDNRTVELGYETTPDETAGFLQELGGDPVAGICDRLSGEDPIDLVPAEADAVATLDAGVLEDETTRSVMNPYLDTTASGPDDPRTLEELVEEYDDRLLGTAAIPVEDLGNATVFTRGGTPQVEEGYFGLLVEGDWDAETLAGELQSEGEFETETYGDRTLYVDTEGNRAFAALGPALVAYGTRDAVTDAIDVADGEADAFGGDLRTAYDATPEDAHVRVAAELPDRIGDYVPGDPGDRVNDTVPGGAGGISPELENVTHVAGAYDTDDDSVEVEMSLFVPTGEGAQRLADDLGAIVQLAPTFLDDDTLADQIAAVEVARENRSAVVSYRRPAGAVADLLVEFGASEETGGSPAVGDARTPELAR